MNGRIGVGDFLESLAGTAEVTGSSALELFRVLLSSNTPNNVVNPVNISKTDAAPLSHTMSELGQGQLRQNKVNARVAQATLPTKKKHEMTTSHTFNIDTLDLVSQLEEFSVLASSFSAMLIVKMEAAKFLSKCSRLRRNPTIYSCSLADTWSHTNLSWTLKRIFNGVLHWDHRERKLPV